MITGVHLVTGLIGSGKTLRAVWYIDQEIKAGRPVYACNVNGLNIPGVIPFDDPRNWRDLPPGALLVVDEAQRYWRARRSGEVPDELQAMETSRHDAVSFLVMTQQPTYLDKHLRGLVTCHEHLYRRMNAQATTVFQWERCVEEPMGSERAIANESMFVYPKRLYGAYKSSEQHTVKFRMGARAKMILLGIVVAGTLIATAAARISGRGEDLKAQAAESAPSALADAAGSLSSSGSDGEPMSVEGYVHKQTPRIATAPWSAPVFDDKKAVADPQLYCASSLAGEDAAGEYREASCTCVTEQGTPYALTVNECRMVARRGAPYNPYKRPQQENKRGVGARAPTESRGVAEASAPGAVIEAEQVSGYGDIGVGKTNSAPR